MFSERVFFSFVALADPSRKREYNEWHQLEHLPENLRLPGVAHGDRWAWTGDGAASPELAGVDYLAMRIRLSADALFPELLTCPGVAGAWTFYFLGKQQHSTLNIGAGADRAPGSLRVRLLYLDEDPVEVSREIAEREKQPAPHPEAERVLLSGPVRTIVPWRDW